MGVSFEGAGTLSRRATGANFGRAAPPLSLRIPSWRWRTLGRILRYQEDADDDHDSED